MPSDTPRRWTKRGKDIKLNYQLDRGGEINLAMRTTVDIGSGDFLTPVVPLILVRQVPELPVSPRGGLDPRAAIACYVAPLNVQGFGKYRVIVPWCAASGNLRPTLKQIEGFVSASPNVTPPNVQSLEYEGESFEEML